MLEAERTSVLCAEGSLGACCRPGEDEEWFLLDADDGGETTKGLRWQLT